MLKLLTTKKILAVCLLAVPSLGTAQQRAAAGPLESVHVEQSRITVLGQTFVFSAATRFAVNGDPVSPAHGSIDLVKGRSVYVEGVDLSDRSVATFIGISDDGYVPGASSVYVYGNVTDVSSPNGMLRIGTLSIDSSAMSPDLLAKISVGSAVEVSGIQPVAGGKLVGLDRVGIDDSGDKRQSIGSASLSIGGSGKQSIGGSGRQVQSIGGSGFQTQSIGGSGTQVQSIGGSGAQRQSIGGSGKQKASIGGSGFQVQSIGGSGAQIQSIGGSGSQVQSIGGSGTQRQSIGGTAIQRQSIGGSGIR